MAAKVGSVYVDFFAKTGKFTKDVGKATRTLDKFGLSVRKVARRSAILAGVIGGAGAALTKSIINAAAESENYGVRLKALLGSTEEANKAFKDMADLAGRIPFEFREVMSAGTQLAGVMQKGREEINQYLPIIADLAAVTGLTLEEATGQVIRMYSAGAAAADLFRERGILAMLGFQAGVTISAEETREQLIRAWEDPLSKFRGAADDLGKTWRGLISMISDRWFQFRNLVAESGLFDAAKSSAQSFIDMMDEATKTGALAEFAEKLSGGIEGAVRGLGKLIGIVGGFIREIEQDPLLLQEGLIGFMLFGPKGAVALPAIGRSLDTLFSKILGGTSAVERIERSWKRGEMTAEAAAEAIAFLTQSEAQNQVATFNLSSVFMQLSENLINFGLSADEAAEVLGEVELELTGAGDAANEMADDFARAQDRIQDRFVDELVDGLGKGLSKAKNILKDFVDFALREIARIFVGRAVGAAVGSIFGPAGAVAGAAVGGGAAAAVPAAAGAGVSGSVISNTYVISSTFGSKGEREAIVREITRIQEGL